MFDGPITNQFHTFNPVRFERNPFTCEGGKEKEKEEKKKKP